MKFIPHSQPTIGPLEAQVAADLVSSGRLCDGEQCQLFEEELANAVGRRFAVVVANGHMALELWLESLELPQGSKIRIPSYCCAALLHSVTRLGFKPQIEDVEEETLGLAPGPSPAISVNMFAIPSRGATDQVLEDCAMGFVPGVTGIRSQAAMLSFYVTKMITTGQGGALLTDDEMLAKQWHQRMQYDNQPNYHPATNRKMTDIQAAIGRIQLRRYNDFLEQRRQKLALYQEQLTSHHLQLHPATEKAADDILFRLPLKVSQEYQVPLIEHLNSYGIESKRPVWRPLHQDQELADTLFPVSLKSHQEIISLPFYPELKSEDIVRIVKTISLFFRSKS